MKKTHTLIGGGRGFIGPADGSAPLRFLGELSKVEITINEEKKTLRNYSTPGGGLADSVSLISEVTLSITGHGFESEAIAMATFGDVSTVTGGDVTEEVHAAYLDGYVRLNSGTDISSVSITRKNGETAPDWVSSTAYEVGDFVVPTTANGLFYQCTTAGTSDASEPTWPTNGATVTDGTAVWQDMGTINLVEGLDFELQKGGVYFPDGATLVDGEQVLIDYTYGASTNIEAILSSGRSYYFVFDGFNQANDDKPVVLDVWKAKASPASIGLVSEEFGQIEYTFDVLKDDSRGAGTSKFFRINQVES